MPPSQDMLVSSSSTPYYYDKSNGSLPLKLVSMNLAGCQPSQEAPPNWNRDTVAEAVRKELLSSDPDIVALQECPRQPQSWAAKYFPGYRVMGVAPSHALYVVLLIRDTLAAHSTPVRLHRGLPAVMAQIQIAEQQQDTKTTIFVASCHLAPFREGSFERSDQMRGLMDAAAGQGPLVIAGDTNMRETEDAVMEGRDFGLLDAWKLAGSDPATQYTWDTRNHLLEGGGGSFNRYYGWTTREYATRYDRIYISSPDTAATTGSAANVSVHVASFGLVANKPLTRPTHFLSDHFGVVCELNITSS